MKTGGQFAQVVWVAFALQTAYVASNFKQNTNARSNIFCCEEKCEDKSVNLS